MAGERPPKSSGKRGQEGPDLSDLDARLSRAEERQRGRDPNRETGHRRVSDSSVGMAFRIAVDIAAGTVVGTLIGYGLDWAFGTLPLFLILFFLLGFGAGFVNVYRTLTGQGYAAGYRRQDGDDPAGKNSGSGPGRPAA